DFVGAALYLVERHPDEVKKKLTEADWHKLQAGEGVTMMLVQMYELSASEAREGVILASTFASVSELRPSAAGNVLAYVSAEADGTIKAQGIEDTKETPAESLAGIVFSELTKVRWLRDGRIVFVSAEINLPMARDDEPSKVSLFVIDPARAATVSRLLTRKVE